MFKERSMLPLQLVNVICLSCSAVTGCYSEPFA